MRSPAYPFYGSDFDQSTASWSCEEVGAYVRLLNHQWDNGAIPGEVPGLARVLRESPARCRRLWRFLESKFPLCEDGLRRNPRMERIRGEREGWVEKSRGGGKRSARLRAARKAGGSHSDEEWLRLCEAAAWHCPRCGTDAPLVRDHVIPLYKGGSDRIENIQPLCRPCNSAKGPEAVDYIAGLRRHLGHGTNRALSGSSRVVEPPLQPPGQPNGNTPSPLPSPKEHPSDAPPKGPPAKSSPPKIPEELETAIPGFGELWSERMRVAGRKKPNRSAEGKQLQLLARTLSKHGPEPVRRAVEDATNGGYTGCFPEKFTKSGAGTSRVSPTTSDTDAERRASRIKRHV